MNRMFISLASTLALCLAANRDSARSHGPQPPLCNRNSSGNYQQLQPTQQLQATQQGNAAAWTARLAAMQDYFIAKLDRGGQTGGDLAERVRQPKGIPPGREELRAEDDSAIIPAWRAGSTGGADH